MEKNNLEQGTVHASQQPQSSFSIVEVPNLLGTCRTRYTAEMPCVTNLGPKLELAAVLRRDNSSGNQGPAASHVSNKDLLSAHTQIPKFCYDGGCGVDARLTSSNGPFLLLSRIYLMETLWACLKVDIASGYGMTKADLSSRSDLYQIHEERALGKGIEAGLKQRSRIKI